MTLTVDPTGRFAHLPEPLIRTIAMFAIDAKTGALTSLATPTSSTTNGTGLLALDPAGRFTYAPEPRSGTVLTHAIDVTTGAISLASLATVAAGAAPTTLPWTQRVDLSTSKTP